MFHTHQHCVYFINTVYINFHTHQHCVYFINTVYISFILSPFFLFYLCVGGTIAGSFLGGVLAGCLLTLLTVYVLWKVWYRKRIAYTRRKPKHRSRRTLLHRGVGTPTSSMSAVVMTESFGSVDSVVTQETDAESNIQGLVDELLDTNPKDVEEGAADKKELRGHIPRTGSQGSNKISLKTRTHKRDGILSKGKSETDSSAAVGAPIKTPAKVENIHEPQKSSPSADPRALQEPPPGQILQQPLSRQTSAKTGDERPSFLQSIKNERSVHVGSGPRHLSARTSAPCLRDGIITPLHELPQPRFSRHPSENTPGMPSSGQVFDGADPLMQLPRFTGAGAMASVASDLSADLSGSEKKMLQRRTSQLDPFAPPGSLVPDMTSPSLPPDVRGSIGSSIGNLSVQSGFDSSQGEFQRGSAFSNAPKASNVDPSLRRSSEDRRSLPISELLDRELHYAGSWKASSTLPYQRGQSHPSLPGHASARKPSPDGQGTLNPPSLDRHSEGTSGTAGTGDSNQRRIPYAGTASTSSRHGYDVEGSDRTKRSQASAASQPTDSFYGRSFEKERKQKSTDKATYLAVLKELTAKDGDRHH